MIIYVEGIGDYTKHFTSEDQEEYGYVSRAYTRSGNSKSDKGWGAGFVSISPNLDIFPDDSDFNPYKLTKQIEDKIAGNVFEGEMRMTNSNQEYLALFKRVDTETEPEKYLLKINFSSSDYNLVPKIQSFDGLIISDASSVNNDGSRMDYQALALASPGDHMKLTSGSLYKIDKNGKMVKGEEEDEE